MSTSSNSTLRRIAVIGGSRIPFCRSNSISAEKTNLDMLAAARGGLVERFGLDGAQPDEVVDPRRDRGPHPGAEEPVGEAHRSLPHLPPKRWRRRTESWGPTRTSVSS